MRAVVTISSLKMYLGIRHLEEFIRKIRILNHVNRNHFLI